MLAPELFVEAERIPGAVPAVRAVIEPGGLRELCEQARAKNARLVALWGSDETPRGNGFALHVALALPRGLAWLTLPLAREHPRYHGIADLFPAANRMQRAAYDLLGIHAEENPDHRKWLRHGAWPGGVFPLRKDFDAASRFPRTADGYPFVKVEGEGVHEIPVGPVHAGTIEPGHFRFSIVGEKILRLEQRLGYKHKGIEKRFEAMTLDEGARLAGRVSGDSTVAFAWAYAMAVEGATGTEPPAARRGAARVLPRAGADREPPRRPRLPRQRRGALVRVLPVLAAQGGPAAPQRRALRPPLPHGRGRARRRGARPRGRGHGPDRGGARPHRAGDPAAPRDLRRARRGAGPLHDHRRGRAGARRADGAHRPRRAGERHPSRSAGRPPDRTLRRARGPHRRPGRRRRRGAGRGALRRALRVGAPGAPAPRAPARGAGPRPGRGTGARPARRRLGRGLARRGARRARHRRARPHPPPAPARPVVAELAAARARGARQHRSRLPADQQVVQPVLQRRMEPARCISCSSKS